MNLNTSNVNVNLEILEPKADPTDKFKYIQC